MYKSGKKIVCIVVSVLIILIIALCIIFSNNYVKKVDFEKDNYSSFSVSDFGNYESIYCQNSRTGSPLFHSDCSLVIASYSEVEFRNKLADCNNYAFQNEIVWCDETSYLLPDTEFDINDWSFRVLKGDNYPNIIDFIALNSVENKIAYLTFCDSDLDYLCTKEDNMNNDFMQKFILKHFKYDF
ncbi:MAG: hypothetical protein NC397_08380 [Clostridium sp.]|nr:hypothetical protein [Clostridium sp.]